MKIKEQNSNGPNQNGNHPTAQSTHQFSISRPPSVFNLKFFSQKKKLQLLLPFKSRPLGTQPQSHPTGSTTPLGKRVSRSGTPLTMGRAPGRYSGNLSPSQSKSQEHGPHLSLWVSQMENLEAAGCSSVPLTSLTMSDKQLNLIFFISESQWQLLRNQTTDRLSKRQPPSPLLPNHKWPCALDSGQSPKGTLWTLGLWSESGPQDSTHKPLLH